MFLLLLFECIYFFCEYGGIGIRVWFRTIWSLILAGSSPVIRT